MVCSSSAPPLWPTTEQLGSTRVRSEQEAHGSSSAAPCSRGTGAAHAASHGTRAAARTEASHTQQRHMCRHGSNNTHASPLPHDLPWTCRRHPARRYHTTYHTTSTCWMHRRRPRSSVRSRRWCLEAARLHVLGLTAIRGRTSTAGWRLQEELVSPPSAAASAHARGPSSSPSSPGKFIFFLSVYTLSLSLPPIRFVLRSVQTYISMRNCFEMCVYTLLKANPMDGRVRAYALKGKKNCVPSSPLRRTLEVRLQCPQPPRRGTASGARACLRLTSFSVACILWVGRRLPCWVGTADLAF